MDLNFIYKINIFLGFKSRKNELKDCLCKSHRVRQLQSCVLKGA